MVLKRCMVLEKFNLIRCICKLSQGVHLGLELEVSGQLEIEFCVLFFLYKCKLFLSRVKSGLITVNFGSLILF